MQKLIELTLNFLAQLSIVQFKINLVTYLKILYKLEISKITKYCFINGQKQKRK